MDQDQQAIDEFLDVLRTDAQRSALVAQDLSAGLTSPYLAPPHNHQLFVSPQTAAQHENLLPYLTQWAGMNVVLITADDLPQNLRTAAKDIQTSYADWMRTRSIPFDDADQALLDQYRADGDILSDMGDNAWAETFKKLTGQNPARSKGHFNALMVKPAYAWNVKDENGTDYCLIRSFDSGITTHDILVALSGMTETPHLVGPAPGTMDDWLALVLAHEAAHCAQGPANEARSQSPDWQPPQKGLSPRTYWPEGSVAREIEADRGALALFNQLAAQNPHFNADTAKAFRASRALSSVQLNGQRIKVSPMRHSHATNPGLSHDGHAPAWGGDTLRFDDLHGLLSALDEASVASTLLIAMTDLPASPDRLRLPVTRCGDFAIAFNRCFTALFETTGQDIRTQSYAMMRYGHHRATQNPALRFAAVLALAETGYFDAAPLQKAYVSQFLTAARDYAPALTRGADIQRFRTLLAANPGLSAQIRAETPFAASAHTYGCLNGQAAPDAPCR